jgi:hypothetical protein
MPIKWRILKRMGAQTGKEMNETMSVKISTNFWTNAQTLAYLNRISITK